MNAPSSVEIAAEPAIETLPLSPGRRLGDFLITRVVGQGGFGIVYEAEDLTLQRRVAIKEYMPSQLATRTDGVAVHPLSSRYAKTFELGRKSFIAEARLLAQFRHPGLLEVLHFWAQNGTAYMVMPFYEGRTLDKVLANGRGVVNEDWLKAMIRPILDALEHMHGEDCYHRDVSADNILIRDNGKALLLDLGAARHVIGGRERALTVMLKPGYAPIEQYADDPACRQGPWTDIYAVAAVLYFAVTARMPPPSASRVMHDSLPPLATLAPDGYGKRFLEAIDRGLSIRPEHRPRTIGEFRSLLFAATPSEALGSGAIAGWPSADPASDVPASARADATKATIRGNRISMRVAAAALLCVAAVAWFVWPANERLAGETAAARARSEAHPPEPTWASSDGTPLLVAEAAAPRPEWVKEASDPGPEVASTPSADTSALPTKTRTNAQRTTATPTLASAPDTSAPASAVVPAGSAAPKAAAAAASGSLRLSVAPWGEVFVDGVSRGVTPPLKQLALSAGRHRVEIRNPAGPAWSKEIVVRAGENNLVTHRFQ